MSRQQSRHVDKSMLNTFWSTVFGKTQNYASAALLHT